MLHHPTPFQTSPPPPEVKTENEASPVANFVAHKRQLQADLSHLRTAYVFHQIIIRPILHVGCKVTHTKTRTMFVFLPSTNFKWIPFLFLIRKVSVQNSAREQSMLNEVFCLFLSSFRQMPRNYFTLCHRPIPFTSNAIHYSLFPPFDAI